MNCTNCIHNEVCKYKADYKGVRDMREEIVQNFDGWAMYRVRVSCEAYSPDQEVLWQEEMEKQVNELDKQIAEVF